MGDIIFTLRHNLGLSQESLAAMCKVSQQFIQKVEKGKCRPSLKTAALIAAALGVTVDELIKGGEK